NLSYDMTFPVTVPEGKLFVLGDNRNDSLDSRSTDIGFINENKVLGKVVFRFYPFDKIEIIKN
ncbi:MAG: signal peptidase I, partial [Acutalibacteraceae bacterium]|nr:signal peptidase I [Acutalibacteraceae bacterium]